MQTEQEKNINLPSENQSNKNEKALENVKEEHPIDARIRRIKDCVLFVVVLTMILGVFCFFISVIFNARSLDVEIKWADIAITAIISVLLGYVVGKSGK